jgi:hypothetical protein
MPDHSTPRSTHLLIYDDDELSFDGSDPST